jgi:hypothetical protein
VRNWRELDYRELPWGAKHTPSRTAKKLALGITRMIDLYACGGFQVGTVLMDNEFEKL